VKILTAAGTRAGLHFEFEERLIGGACLEAMGLPVEAETLEACRQADAVFLGAVGGPQWDALPGHLRPEKGLLALRKAMGCYANLRPAKVFPALASASTLRREVVEGLDLLVVRELTGGIYFGAPKRVNDHEGVDTLRYTSPEVERIARVAFEAARGRRQKVTSVDKANVLASSQLWRRVVNTVAADYPDVTLEHMLVDNAAMQLLRHPAQFDVIVTGNMFGDILSDEASMLTGSLGMLPSASLGEGPGLYEPVHGSAPDIAGQNRANPLATIGSAALMLRHSFGMHRESAAIESAMATVLTHGARTADLLGTAEGALSTEEITCAVLKAFESKY